MTMREIGPPGDCRSDRLLAYVLLCGNCNKEARRPRPSAEVTTDHLRGVGSNMWITDWTSRAACRGADPDALFVQGAAQNRAKLICRGCPVRTECLADALDNRIEFGVWGGMTERERRALLRRRPDVDSWRDLLESAKEEYERTNELIAG